MYNVF